MMNEKQTMTSEFQAALEQWANESLRGIGIIKGRHADFDKLKDKVIGQLRSIYSDTTIAMFLQTTDNRTIDTPDGFARILGSCGDTMEIFLKVQDGVIVDASFKTDGCIPSQAAGGMVVKLTKGKRPEEISLWTDRMLLEALDGLPEDHEHCATLAMDTLHRALEDFQARKRVK